MQTEISQSQGLVLTYTPNFSDTINFSMFYKNATRFQEYLADYTTPEGEWDLAAIYKLFNISPELQEVFERNNYSIIDTNDIPEPALVPITIPSLKVDRLLDENQIEKYLTEFCGVSVKARAAIFVVQIRQPDGSYKYFRMDGKHRCVLTLATNGEFWVPALIFKVSSEAEAFHLYEKINKSGRKNLDTEEGFYALWKSGLCEESTQKAQLLSDMKLCIKVKGHEDDPIGYKNGCQVSHETFKNLRRMGVPPSLVASEALQDAFPNPTTVKNGAAYGLRGISYLCKFYEIYEGGKNADLIPYVKAWVSHVSIDRPMKYFSFSSEQKKLALDISVAYANTEAFRNYLKAHKLEARITLKLLRDIMVSQLNKDAEEVVTTED